MPLAVRWSGMADHSPLAPIAWTWIAHGCVLLVLAGMLPVLVAQVSEPEWAEAVVMLGAERLIAPVRAIAPEMSAQAPGCALIGGLCLLLAGWTLATRQRWPLHLLAAAHLALVPLATWWGHGLAERTGLGGLGNTISELVLMLATVALLLWSMWKVQRTLSPGPVRHPTSSP